MLHNRFLASLSAADLTALGPRLRLVELEKGQTLIEQDERAGEVHFPVDAQLANVIVLEDGTAHETSLVGREGVSGLAPVMADVPCGWRVTVRVSGSAYVVRADAFRAAQKASTALMKRSLELASFYEAQAAQTAACNLAHKTIPRFARWLLNAADLTPGADLHFTQEEMAGFLGAQRTTLNDAAGALRDAKTIKYSRGVIRIVDREKLERQACECYGALRARAAAMNVGLAGA